jgi:serine/threonine protein kinase
MSHWSGDAQKGIGEAPKRYQRLTELADRECADEGPLPEDQDDSAVMTDPTSPTRDDVDPGPSWSSDELGASTGSLIRELARAPDIEPPQAERDFTGEILGRFRIAEKLGEGGMGVVYVAHDLMLRRRVALKLVRQIERSDGHRRLLREARSAAAIAHPNIATVYEVGEHAGRIFIAMELVPGKTLRDRLDAVRGGDGLPIAEATTIAREISRALVKAHEAGVVHCDLKPENRATTRGRSARA